MAQKKIRKPKGAQSGGSSEEEQVPPTGDQTTKATDDLDRLLDEIDDVLEENAEEFVKGYVQRGGE